MRVCKAALDGVKADEVKDCLSLEASVSIGARKGRAQAAFSQCEEQQKKKNFKGSFHETKASATPSAQDSCSCVCPGDGSTNTMCCSRERGQGKLTVTVERASGLWGDYTSRTDAYVKVSFQGREVRTATVWNADNPV
ncbi:unnamed protein product [Caretta caretta]